MKWESVLETLHMALKITLEMDDQSLGNSVAIDQHWKIDQQRG